MKSLLFFQHSAYHKIYAIFFLIIPAAFPVIESYDFCSSRQKEEEICGADKRHIVCYPDSVPMSGEYVATAPMTYKLMRTLLKTMNDLRNDVASGAVSTYPKAAHMRQLNWNVELEYIAFNRVNRCSIAADQCHSSRNFKRAAEIHGLYGSPERETIHKTFEHVFGKIREQANSITDPAQLTKGYTAEHESSAADFAAIVNDQVSKVGCGVAYCTNCQDESGANQQHCLYVTCVFNDINEQNCSVYMAAQYEAAEACDIYGSEPSKDFKSLCTNNDKLYDNRCLVPMPAPKPAKPPSTKPKPPAAKPKPPAAKPKPPAAKPKPPAPEPPETSQVTPATAPAKPSKKPGKPGKPSKPEPPIEDDVVPKIEDDKYGMCKVPTKTLCWVNPGSESYVCSDKAVTTNGTLQKVFQLTEEDKDFIVKYHNEQRNEVAGGREKRVKKELNIPYPQAARMREMIWDDELAWMAEKHARFCYFEHDKCHNTLTYRSVGQNLGFKANTKLKRRFAQDIALSLMEAWFLEKNLIEDPAERMISYDAAKTKKEASGHYCSFVVDQIQRIGCALTRCAGCTYEDKGVFPFCWHFTCHYDMCVFNDKGIYKTGKPGSKCNEYKTGISKKYPDLCAVGPLVEYTLWSKDNLKGVRVNAFAPPV